MSKVGYYGNIKQMNFEIQVISYFLMMSILQIDLIGTCGKSRETLEDICAVLGIAKNNILT
jgi:hypothetical protein